MTPFPIYVGFDNREAVAYHTFCNSVIRHSSVPVAFIPLTSSLMQPDGSNAFTLARFLVPYLAGYKGWALYADGDMVCKADIAELIALRTTAPVAVVKHRYRTKHPVKYLGAPNPDYPRKNWSSVVLWWCAHYGNRCLTPEYVRTAKPSDLHRFAWTQHIASLPKVWNWLPQEYGENPKAKIVHYTIGTPCFEEYGYDVQAQDWHSEHRLMSVPWQG